MKRVIAILIIMMLLPVMVYAQLKKVAVWETKCSDNSITTFQSTMVRGGMETAVGNAGGYEVYDRSAFDAITKEQKFQRSGMVSDSEIKRLGEMAGVQYIIVPEATASGGEFYILVKMLDVETGKFGAVYEELCGISGVEIKKACTILGKQLFGDAVGASSDGGLHSGGDFSTSPVRERPPSQNQDYVDLGLPSGTLWKKTNESEKLDYNSAFSKYGQRMPTRDHVEELVTYCTLEWTGNGYKVTGKNGKYIFLPATDFGNHVSDGIAGFYWLYSSVAKRVAPILHLGPNGFSIGSGIVDSSNTETIRLIKEP